MTLNALLNTPLEHLPQATQRLRAELLREMDNVADANKKTGTRTGLAIGGMIGASGPFVAAMMHKPVIREFRTTQDGWTA